MEILIAGLYLALIVSLVVMYRGFGDVQEKIDYLKEDVASKDKYASIRINNLNERVDLQGKQRQELEYRIDDMNGRLCAVEVAHKALQPANKSPKKKPRR